MIHLREWEVDLITSQADESTWQSSTLTSADLDGYQGKILSLLVDKKAILISYEDLQTTYLVNLHSEFVGEFHVFSTGGTWKLTESFRRFQRDVWNRCGQMRIETRVRKPALQAILKRCGVPVESVRRKSWYDKDQYLMVDEKVYALHRVDYEARQLPTHYEVERFEDKVAMLAVSLVENFTLETLPVRHFFVDGMYTRELTIEKGKCVIGYKQNFDHMVIISGDVTVSSATGVTRYMGPHNTFPSAAGVQRTAYAHADTIFTTTHKLRGNEDERDIQTIEAQLFSGSYEAFKQRYLTNQGLLQCQVQ